MSTTPNTVELSIIIPNYNNSQYLDDCIRSVLQQTYENFEVIISDDNSSDNSVSIINKWIKTNPEIRLLEQQKNIGVSKNRHDAILQAKGNYITTLDSDDIYIDPEKLEKEMQLVSFHKRESGIDVCAFSNVVIVDKTLNTVGYQWPEDKIKEGYIFNDIIARSSMIPRDFIFLKSDYHSIGGYDPRFNLYEDWDLKIRLAKKREFYFTKCDGVGYQRSGGGLSAVPLHKHIHAIRKIFKKNVWMADSQRVGQLKEEINIYLNKLKLQYLSDLELERKKHANKNRRIKGLWISAKYYYYKYML